MLPLTDERLHRFKTARKALTMRRPKVDITVNTSTGAHLPSSQQSTHKYLVKLLMRQHPRPMLWCCVDRAHQESSDADRGLGICMLSDAMLEEASEEFFVILRDTRSAVTVCPESFDTLSGVTQSCDIRKKRNSYQRSGDTGS